MNVRGELIRLQGNLRLEGPTTAVQRGGQERDFWRSFSTRDRRRLAALGVTSASGEAPDRFVQLLSEAPGAPGWLHEVSGDVGEVCERWCREVLSAADHDGAERRQPDDEVELGAELPAWVDGWLEHLAWGPKRDYARAFAGHVFCGWQAPEPIEAGWARKVERKVANRYAAQLGRGEVAVWSDHDGEEF